MQTVQYKHLAACHAFHLVIVELQYHSVSGSNLEMTPTLTLETLMNDGIESHHSQGHCAWRQSRATMKAKARKAVGKDEEYATAKVFTKFSRDGTDEYSDG